tara:strand:- start:34 stop:774 length:741 start_codon:yes stop_codon:yes gene_type:complete
MNNKACIVTGSSGEIGSAICKYLQDNNFFVIGVDKQAKKNDFCNIYLKYDLNKVINDSKYQKDFKKILLESIKEFDLSLLVNNAAVQRLIQKKDTKITNLIESFNVNSIAPYLIYKVCEKSLLKNNGTCINIGSIHSTLSKKQFGFYAASKSALKSLTNSIAIENEGKILTYLIEPAAIDSKMLKAGFKNKSDIKKLREYHPSNSIGRAEDISKIIMFLHESKIKFLHGTCIDLSGGIKSLLHDPG